LGGGRGGSPELLPSGTKRQRGDRENELLLFFSLFTGGAVGGEERERKGSFIGSERRMRWKELSSIHRRKEK